ncbi:hypothetical protein GGI18_006040 [Coemansia linderi]|uniref:Uncharacterized protein n=1 Tax=Coemansia linderi TaxID=2663919 RepID=A0ACC1JS68_9FUNG|nr:hypothetical protein GGI18_006040 [Coemansia linderi]
MKLNATSLIKVEQTVLDECAKYDTATCPFILVFTLDTRRQNYLALEPRPRDNGEHYGPWLDGQLPYDKDGRTLKKYSQESWYESDDCFFAVHFMPTMEEEVKFNINVFLIEPEDAYAREVELYRNKKQYVASLFNVYRCLDFSTLKSAIYNMN